MFGSDFPYAFERHAKDVISFLVSKPFYDAGGTIKDVQNILGRNIFHLLPEYNLPQKQVIKIPNPTAVHARPQNGTKALSVVSQVIVKLVEDRKVEISKFIPTFKDSFNTYENEYLMETKWNVDGEEKKVWFSVLKILENDMYALGPIGSDGPVQCFGYSYFDPDGFIALDPLTRINLVEDPDSSWSQMKQLFDAPIEEKPKLKRLKPIRRRPTKPVKGRRPVKSIKPTK
jgi:hypothetical protein